MVKVYFAARVIVSKSTILLLSLPDHYPSFSIFQFDNMSQFYLIFFVFFCLKTETKAQNIFKCDKSADEEADRMVGKLMTIGEVDLRFPESNQEMIDFCR